MHLYVCLCMHLYVRLCVWFIQILTAYLELHVCEGAMPLILEYWEKVAGCLSHQLSTVVSRSPAHQKSSSITVNAKIVLSSLSVSFSSQYCAEMIYSLKNQVVSRIRDIDLSCYTLVLPILQEVADKSVPNKKLVSYKNVCDNLSA